MASVVIQGPYSALVVAGTASQSAPTARFLLGIVNYAATAQTGITFTITDNNGNAGPIVTAPAAAGVTSYPPPGIPINGINVAVSGGTPTAPGVAFLYRTQAG